MKFVIWLHRIIFVRRRFFKLNRFLYKLALKGIGVLNYESWTSSGERTFLKEIFSHRNGLTLFDVGANIGDYSRMARQLDASATITAFEPNPTCYQQLAEAAEKFNMTAVNVALGDSPGEALLFDDKDHGGSQHASIYRAVMEDIHKYSTVGIPVNVITLDDYIVANSIAQINLLKIDAEGHELKILLGASRSIRAGIIEIIHLEFNEMNVVSRTFMKDFWDLLSEYRMYRMFPDGLLPLKEYSVFSCEIFAYQNIVAIHQSSSFAFYTQAN